MCINVNLSNVKAVFQERKESRKTVFKNTASLVPSLAPSLPGRVLPARQPMSHRLARQPASQPDRLPDSQFTIWLVNLIVERANACLYWCGTSGYLSQTHKHTHLPSASVSFRATEAHAQQERTLLYLPVPQSSAAKTTQNKRLLPVAQLTHPLPRCTAPPK